MNRVLEEITKLKNTSVLWLIINKKASSSKRTEYRTERALVPTYNTVCTYGRACWLNEHTEGNEKGFQSNQSVASKHTLSQVTHAHRLHCCAVPMRLTISRTFQRPHTTRDNANNASASKNALCKQQTQSLKSRQQGKGWVWIEWSFRVPVVSRKCNTFSQRQLPSGYPIVCHIHLAFHSQAAPKPPHQTKVSLIRAWNLNASHCDEAYK